MDFFTQQERARQQTRRLFWLFGLAVLVAMALNYFVVAAFLRGLQGGVFQLVIAPLIIGSELLLEPIKLFHRLWFPHLAWLVGSAMLVSIIGGCFYKIRLLSRGGAAVAELLGGREVSADTKNPHERQLLNVVEEMAIASGMPVPVVYVLDRERGLNSFAAGHTREDVAIGVTLAAMQLLSRDELQGMLAHEFSHVLNGDTRLNMKLMGLAHGLMWPTIVGRVLLRGTSDELEIGESYLDKDTSVMRLPLVPIAVPLLIIGGLNTPLVRWVKSSICREREWLADAAAVQFTRNPAGIEGALKKVGGLLKEGRLDTAHAEVASHLYFVNSRHESWFGFQSTHPPLKKRVAAIDPQFDGQFAHIKSLSVKTQDAEYDRRYAASVERARVEAQSRESE